MRAARNVITVGLAFGATLAAGCAAPESDSGHMTAADAIAQSATGSFEHFESSGGRFAVDFPAVWRGSYTSTEHADTTAGARYAVAFTFKPNPRWGVEPRTLMVIRIFPKAAWARIEADSSRPIAAKVGQKGDDVFAVSLVPSNPYKPGTPAADKFDLMVLSVVQDSVPLRLTPR